MSTCSCGAEEKQVDRQTAARQYASEIDFRDPSWDWSPEAANPFDPSNIYEQIKDPNLRSSISGPSLEFDRETDTFCANFAEHDEAYDRLVGEIKVTEIASDQDLEFQVEDAVDVERLRSKVESLRAEANSLSEAQLRELRDELTAMQESLSSRIRTMQEGGPRQNTASLARLESLEQETRQVVQNHLTAELAERADQSRTPPDTEAAASEQPPDRDATRSRSGTRTRQTQPADSEETPDPDPCETCGRQQERVTRQTTARQFRSELEFRTVSFGVSGGLELFGSDGTVDPTPSVSVDATANFQRTKETFCSNFSGDRAAYTDLVNDIDTVENLASRNGPGQYIEESIDVERVRSKIESLRTEVRDLSEAKLTQLREELTAMRESLTDRIQELQDNQQLSQLREMPGIDDLSKRAQRLQNLEQQAQQVLDNHIEEELAHREQHTVGTDSWRDRHPDGDRPSGSTSREHASDAEPEPQSCDRCDEDMRRVDRQTWLRQQTEEMELRELDVGVGVDPFTGAPSPTAAPTFDRTTDEFCANFAGDETAYHDLLTDIDDVATTASRNGIGQYVEDSVDVERVRSKLETLPESVEQLSTGRLRQVRDGLTEMRESLEQRVQELQNNQQWDRLRKVPGIDDLSKRAQRLQNLKQQATEVIQQHLDEELLQRRLDQGRRPGADDPGGAPESAGDGSRDSGSGSRSDSGSDGAAGDGTTTGSDSGSSSGSGSGSGGGSDGSSGPESGDDSTPHTDEDAGAATDDEPETDHRSRRSETEEEDEDEEEEQAQDPDREEDEEEDEDQGPDHEEDDDQEPGEDEEEEEDPDPGPIL